MRELRVTSWKRQGHDRLYVNLPDGTAVAWADRTTGEITFLDRKYGDAAVDALARQDPGPPQSGPTAAPIPDSLPPLTPDNDLAAERPGTGLLDRIAARVLGRRPGRAAEARVGAELDRLTKRGWHVLHAVPLPDGPDLEHLLIGLGGVFTIHTRHHPEKAVWVGDDTLRMDGADPQPYVADLRAEARRVAAALERHCGFRVPVQPVLVWVDVSKLDVVPTQLEVRVYQERQVASLGPMSGALDPAQVERVHTVARDRRCWLTA
ncbi:nuclease-related domain-containing protein [Streptomyces purpureus]|uniref:nuclease-related domain-containing protein n=1 Tax=Streptomyces purpureus TaxID=1951 RepID=UPI003796D6FB